MINLNIIGLDETIAKLDKLANSELKQELASIIESGAKLFVRGAQRDAARRFGALANGINYYPQGGAELSRTVVSSKHYSAYMEWGTINFVSVPAELADYAIQFKGRGIRKNGGIVPRPFFFKQTPLVEKYLNETVQAFLNGIQL